MRNPLIKIAVALAVGLCIIGDSTASRTWAADQATTEAAREEQVIADNCEICHSDVLIRQQHLSESAWLTELKKMKSWGSPIETEQMEQLAKFLVHSYGIDAPPFTAQTIPAGDALALYRHGAKGPGGDATKGKSLYVDACASCHGPGALGALGPELVAAPVLWRWKDFDTAVMQGRGRMPAMSNVLDSRQVADILAWLRTLNENDLK